VSIAGLPRGLSQRVERRMTPEPARELPRDPVQWITGELGEFLWSAQRTFLRAVVEHRDVAWQACHGPGKSYSAARLIAWWIAAHPLGEAIAVTSAPTGDQVRKILWRELTRAHRRAGLPGTITRGAIPEWTINGEVVAFGRKPADLQDQAAATTAFQGIHARYVLFLLDEAGGVPEWLWTASTTAVTNESSRRVAIGNPDDPTSHFARICAPGSGWHVLQTSVFDTPNFTGEHVPEQMREALPSPVWEEERRREWGDTNPLYISKVTGLFPDVSDDVVITPRMVAAAKVRDLPGLVPGRFGFDVARRGTAESAIYRNRGGQIRLVQAWRGADTTLSTANARAILDEAGGVFARARMSVDVVGLGAGVGDTLRNEGYPIDEFNGGERARDPGRFVNARTEAWWAFREALVDGLIDLDPDDELLLAQLQGPRWGLDSSAKRIRLETKDEMQARGVPSPDRADAAVQSWYEGNRVHVPAAVTVLRTDGEATSITGDLLDRPT
jgi:hypothetical protein